MSETMGETKVIIIDVDFISQIEFRLLDDNGWT